MYRPPPVRPALPGVVLFAALLAAGCSIRQYTIRQLGGALADSGGQTFASDDDPELIKAAAPFSLKLMESLLAADPGNDKLLLAAAEGFTEYAYAFVQPDADALEAAGPGAPGYPPRRGPPPGGGPGPPPRPPTSRCFTGRRSRGRPRSPWPRTIPPSSPIFPRPRR